MTNSPTPQRGSKIAPEVMEAAQTAYLGWFTPQDTEAVEATFVLRHGTPRLYRAALHQARQRRLRDLAAVRDSHRSTDA